MQTPTDALAWSLAKTFQTQFLSLGSVMARFQDAAEARVTERLQIVALPRS